MDRNIVGELANDRPRPRLAEYLLSGEKLDIDLCRRRDVEGPVGDNQLVDATIRQPVMGNLPSIRKIRLPCITAARDRFSAVELGQRRFDPRHPRLECFAIRACNRSEEHTSELQSLMRNSYAVFCLTQTIMLLTNYN